MYACRDTAQTNSKVILLKPFKGLDPILTGNVYNRIKALYPNSFISLPVEIPNQCYYAPRKRYRADKLISYLHQHTEGDTVTIGLIAQDISTTKGKYYDWGVMGLGYCPGNACIVSTFRLSKNQLMDQFYKVAIHELGHTQGLPHCANKSCFMRDAEGGNTLNEEVDFCVSCKAYLKSKGWKFL